MTNIEIKRLGKIARTNIEIKRLGKIARTK